MYGYLMRTEGEAPAGHQPHVRLVHVGVEERGNQDPQAKVLLTYQLSLHGLHQLWKYL